MAHLDDGQILNLTQSESWEVQPDLDGDLVIWKDGYNGIGIHGMHISTGRVFTVTEGHSDTSRPYLSGEVVVWSDGRVAGDPGNIYGYNIQTQSEFVISDAAGWQGDPRIDGDWVVWWDYQEHVWAYNVRTRERIEVHDRWGARLPDVSAADNMVVWQDMRNGNWDLYGFDLRTRNVQPLIIAPDAQEYASIADGLIVFQSRVYDTSWDIHMHVLSSGLTFAVTNNSNPQINVSVDGYVVAWQDGRNHQYDIYSFEWTGQVPDSPVYSVEAPSGLQVGAFPQQRIYLQWRDNADDEQGFKIERATGIYGTEWQEIADLAANTTTYDDLERDLGESYWYRVRAYNDEGYSAYSNEAFSSTFDDTPSLDEQYLMLLINEARADPGEFGYPGYSPAPPLVYNPLLAYSARAHSQSILNSGFQIGHCDQIGRCPTERARAVGYTEGQCAENLTIAGTGPESMAGANLSFMNSEGHRNNMMEADFNEIGVGHTYDPLKGDESWHGQVTEVFSGRPSVTIPALPMGAVTPYEGPTDQTFTFAVNFYSSEGYTPSRAQVFIDGQPHAMSLSTGTASLGTWRYSTHLPLGRHSYYFEFRYGPGRTARWPESGSMEHPYVRVRLPDLELWWVEASTPAPVVHSQVTLTAYVRNQAGEAEADHVSVRFYDGSLTPDAAIGEVAVGHLSTEEWGRAASILWTPIQAGRHTIYAVVNPDGDIDEIRRDNNIVQMVIEVGEDACEHCLYLPLTLYER
jgi:beta propeller repeat protein